MNAGKNLKKSQVGIELIRLLAAEGDRVFSTDRAREFGPRVGLKNAYLWEALYHLRRNGWIVALRRGLYALSATVPGVTPVHEFEIAMALVDPAAISHWSALHHHGLTEQAPRRVFVLTTTDASVPRMRRDRARKDRGGFLAGDTTYQFVQVKPERFFGTEKVWIGEARVIDHRSRAHVARRPLDAAVLRRLRRSAPRLRGARPEPRPPADHRVCPEAGRGHGQASRLGARTPRRRSLQARTAGRAPDQGLPQARSDGAPQGSVQHGAG